MKVPALIFATTLALGGATLLSASAEASVAYTFTSSPISYDTQLSLGFTFTANVNFDVTSLGYYNYLGTGFLTPHEVGIFSGDGGFAAGPLLASTTLASGTSGTLGPNDFRYQAITPLALVAGDTYTIAGFSPNISGNDPWVYGGPSETTGFSVNPNITIPLNAARYTYDSGVLLDPSSHYADYQFYAVNFNGPVSTIPELSTWAMMLCGFAGLGLAGYRGAKANTAA
jgi:hypothetical protein